MSAVIKFGAIFAALFTVYHYVDSIETPDNVPTPDGTRSAPLAPSLQGESSIAESGLDSSYIFDSSSKRISKIGIIGAGGYIGSVLYDYLSTKYDVVGYDINPPTGREHSIIQKTASDIGQHELTQLDAVVYLGGLSGSKACEDVSHDKVNKENVEDPVNLARRMDKDQLFVFASTSALAQGSGSVPQKEDAKIQENQLDSYGLSMLKREQALRLLSRTKPDSCKLVGLRFGLVAGVSPAQRTDGVHTALVKSAFTNGVLSISHGETSMAFLALSDLVRAVGALMSAPGRAKQFDIFNVNTYNGNVAAVANEVSMQTGARIVAKDDVRPVLGHSLSSDKFKNTFRFEFRSSQHDIVAEIKSKVPESITAKGVHQTPPLDVGKEEGKDSMPCPVCGSHHLQETLDLHKQPLANDFRPNISSALEAPKFPLKLVRCKVCNHLYLSTFVNRQALFSKYLYKSGTSRTLQEYFKWLANKVAAQARPERKNNGKVLEIASNDGSQLDQFKAIGWDTYGVDPAANIVPVSVEKGHNAVVGFWGMEKFSHLPPPEELDAIVAQNVFAHVPNPIDFLKACRDVMGENTKLYIQTSQCQMHQHGQFDTAYHEHISFFTGHSFYKAAQLAGLYISNFELTPIHGTSCFVTFRTVNGQRKVDVPSVGLQKRLDEETADGIPTDFFYTKYQARAHFTRSWIHNQLTGLAKSGYNIGAYGAAAKGMVLLQFLLEIPKREWKLSFVLDDAPLKQNTYCPGTDIPVRPTSSLQNLDHKKPLAMVVLAWNFWKEISENIRRELKGKMDSVLVICPFPEARLIKLDINGPPNHENVLVDIPYRPAPWPVKPEQVSHESNKLMLVGNFKNDEALLPHWIRHHASMFDDAIMVNYGSEDNSVDIIRKEAPSSWKVVNASFEPGDSAHNQWRKQNPSGWSISLTTDEFLVHPNLRKATAAINGGRAIYKFPSVNIIGDDSRSLRNFESLLIQRSVYGVGGEDVCYKDPYNSDSGIIHSGPSDFAGFDEENVPKWQGRGLVMRFTDNVEFKNAVGQVPSRGFEYMKQQLRKQQSFNLQKRNLKNLETKPRGDDDHFFGLSQTYHEAIVPEVPTFMD